MKIQLIETGKDCLIRDFRVGQFFSLLNEMPGRKKWRERELVFNPSGANIEFLLERCPDAEWESGADLIRDSYLGLKMQEENTRQDKKAAGLLTDSSGYEFRLTPFRHQLECFLMSRDLESFAFFHEQGTGKTKPIIDTAAYQYEKGTIDTLLVVAKSGAHINWVVEEIPKHMPERIPYNAVYFSVNWKDSEVRAMTEAAKTASGYLRIVTFHLEGIKYLNSGELGKLQRMLMAWLETSAGCMLVIDESSKIKNFSADRTKFLLKAGKLAKFRRIMTGTPVTSGIENLYSQFAFLDPRILGHTSFTAFRSEYCIMGGFEGRQITGYKNTDKLIKIIDGHSHRVLEKDCLDLPERIYKRRHFEMSAGQRKLYDAYRKQALEEIIAILGEEEGMKRAAEISITRALRLHQIACGLTPSENAEPLSYPNPRLEVTLDEIEEATASGRKIICWSRFKPSMHELYGKLKGIKTVRYYGGVSEDEKKEASRRIQNDDRCQILIASSAAAYSYTWTAVTRNVYHSQSSSLDIRLQSEKRSHRIGTTEHVLMIDVEAKNSVDRKIINALKAHKNLADQITQDPRIPFLEDE